MTTTHQDTDSLAAFVDASSRAARWRMASTATLAIVCVLAVALSSGAARPIWIDEFLHFALAGLSSTEDAWEVVRATILNINHGQTGIYMLLDYWLLSWFGASSWALRALSLLSGLLLFASAAAVLRFRGFALGWQLAPHAEPGLRTMPAISIMSARCSKKIVMLGEIPRLGFLLDLDE